MPNLHDIERRIKSVNSTKQITRTMEMVAAAKIRRASERVESALPWAVAISDMLISTAKYAHLDNEPLLQVHDELIVECPEDEAARVQALLEEEMSGVMTLAVPLPAEAHCGKNWLTAKG